MKKLKIGYFADGVWGHNTFMEIIKYDIFEIGFVTPRYDSLDPKLRDMANQYKIPFIPYKDINSKEFINIIAPIKCDIFVSMSFNQIFKDVIINIPPLKVINCHAGKLPKYRGRNILNWAIINNEKEFGITVHYVDDGIDTGDIILQKTYPINEYDTYATILHIAHTECANVLIEALKLIYDGKATRIKQKDGGFYCSQRIMGDEMINWDKSSVEIYNFIRAICPPAIGARSYIKNQIIQINRAALISNAPLYICKPGAVVGIENDGIIIKTKDSTIKIIDYIYDGKIKIGDILSVSSSAGGGANNFYLKVNSLNIYFNTNHIFISSCLYESAI